MSATVAQDVLTDDEREALRDYCDTIRAGGSYPGVWRLEDRAGMQRIGSGTERFVLDAGDYVLKVPNGPCVDQMRDEILNWEFAPDDLRQWLAPVHGYAADGVWLLMEYAHQEPNYRAGREVAQDVNTGIKRAGYDAIDMGRNNTGSIDGDPVAIDYGYAIHPPDSYRIGPRPEEFFDPLEATTQ